MLVKWALYSLSRIFFFFNNKLKRSNVRAGCARLEVGSHQAPVLTHAGSLDLSIEDILPGSRELWAFPGAFPTLSLWNSNTITSYECKNHLFIKPLHLDLTSVFWLVFNVIIETSCHAVYRKCRVTRQHTHTHIRTAWTQLVCAQYMHRSSDTEDPATQLSVI